MMGPCMLAKPGGATLRRPPPLRPLPPQGQTKALLEPRPKVSEYYERLKARPSYLKTFGPALSPATTAVYILPALAKALLCQLTGCY